MSSIRPDGTSEQTRDCPDCGTEMSFEIITEHGTRTDTTLYQGWWCPSCRKGMVACAECTNLHHPDFECEPQRKARLDEARELFGGMVMIPRHGAVSIDDCELRGEGTPVYIDDGGCPECGGDLIFELYRDADFADGCPNTEYRAICEYCSQLDDGCSYRGT